MDIPSILKSGASKKGITQKILALETHITRATTHNYLTPGYQIPKEEAIRIANAIDDFPTKANIAFALLETLPAFNGTRVDNSAIGFKSFADSEEKEEKDKYSSEEIARVLSSSQEYIHHGMSHKDIQKLRNWLDEYLDEILMEVMVFDRSCDLIGVGQSEVINGRMKVYRREGYMKEDKQDEKNINGLHHQRG